MKNDARVWFWIRAHISAESSLVLTLNMSHPCFAMASTSLGKDIAIAGVMWNLVNTGLSFTFSSIIY